MEPEYIEMAKTYAAKHNISVSKLFKSFVKEKLAAEPMTDPLLEKYKDVKISDKILSLSGILKGKYPDDMDYKDMRYEYLKDKYGL